MRSIPTLLLTSLLLMPTLCRAEGLQHELLLFASGEGIGTFDRQQAGADSPDQVFKLDLVGTVQWHSFRLLGEYLLADREGDLERLELGWQPSEHTIAWAGRYHQPASVWNHDHHHGQFLATSITRPAIEEWEDGGGEVDQGYFPQHFTGVLLEDSRSGPGGLNLRSAVGAGIAPVLRHDGLEPLNVLHPLPMHGGRGAQGKVELCASEFEESCAGVLLAHDRIASRDWPGRTPFGFADVELGLYGVFGRLVRPDWKLFGTWYLAHARLASAVPGRDHSFGVGYVQAEHSLSHRVTGFVRWEDSTGAGEARYVQLFRNFVRTRRVAGVRWDFLPRHALTLELADTNGVRGSYKTARLQWSAAFD